MTTHKKKFSDRILARIRHSLSTGKHFARHTLQHSPPFSERKKDLLLILALLLVSILLRFPALDHPNEPIFDERIYSAFTLLSAGGNVYFDIHPPLARIMMTEIFLTQDLSPYTLAFTRTVAETKTFLDFPYVPLRTGTAILGILIPLVLFALARALGSSRMVAGLIGFFVALEPALIVYSRTILPDSLMILLEFSALLVAVLALREKKKTVRYLLVILAGILIGAAVSVKWVALGMLGVIGLFFLSERKIGEAVAIGVITIFIYFLSFFYFLDYFPKGGPVDPVLDTYRFSYVESLSLPRDAGVYEKILFVGDLHRAIWEANTDPNASAFLPKAPHPLSWSIAKAQLFTWLPDDRPAQIIFRGNAFLWNIALLCFIFNILWIGAVVMIQKKWPIGRNETLLIVGYLANYVPFFLIDRSMFLYHYFTALLFLFLLLPYAAPRLLRCLTLLTKDRLLPRVLFILSIIFIIATSLSMLPTIYGI
jgi:dolichyl-phosphate-mannose--protein O-mannosyl transferase